MLVGVGLVRVEHKFLLQLFSRPQMHTQRAYVERANISYLLLVYIYICVALAHTAF